VRYAPAAQRVAGGIHQRTPAAADGLSSIISVDAPTRVAHRVSARISHPRAPYEHRGRRRAGAVPAPERMQDATHAVTSDLLVATCGSRRPAYRQEHWSVSESALLSCDRGHAKVVDAEPIGALAFMRREVSRRRSHRPRISPLARPAASPASTAPYVIGRQPCSPAEGGADVCWTRANADRDEVEQRDLADRRPRSANREAEAVTRLQSPAATSWRSNFRDTLSRRAGRTTTRSAGARAGARRVVYLADRRDPAARPRASPNAFRARDVHRAVAAPTPREKAPNGFLLGLSGRPAHPITVASWRR
jgi:hypothetical protein